MQEKLKKISDGALRARLVAEGKDPDKAENFEVILSKDESKDTKPTSKRINS